MNNHLRKALVCAAMATSLVATATVSGSSSASASPVSSVKPSLARGGGFWDSRCNSGRACIVVMSNGDNGKRIWNFDGCGGHPINDYYNAASTHGNGLTVYYQNGTWDYLGPKPPGRGFRWLDPNNLITWAHVWC